MSFMSFTNIFSSNISIQNGDCPDLPSSDVFATLADSVRSLSFNHLHLRTSKQHAASIDTRKVSAAMQGWLIKSSRPHSGIATFMKFTQSESERRWCVLKPGILNYYKEKVSVVVLNVSQCHDFALQGSSQLQNQLALVNEDGTCVPVSYHPRRSSKGPKFTIRTSKKMYTFAADSDREGDIKRWHDAIRRAQKAVANDPSFKYKRPKRRRSMIPL